MSKTEEILKSVTETTNDTIQNIETNIANKIPTKSSKKLKNIIILFGFLLIASLLANMIMWFIMSGNSSKVSQLNGKLEATQNLLNAKTGLADQASTLEQQIIKLKSEADEKSKLTDDAINKTLKSEADLKSFKDKMTALETSNAKLTNENANLSATNIEIKKKLDAIKTSLTSLGN